MRRSLGTVWLRSLVPALLLSAGTVSAGTSAAGPVEGQPADFSADFGSGTVAFRAIAGRFASDGVPMEAAKVDAHTLPGWWVGASPRDFAPGAFVTPVFEDLLGGEMFPTRYLLLVLDESAAAADAMATVAAVDPGARLDQSWEHLPGIYRVELSARDGMAVIAAAAQLARTPGVRVAEPDMVFTGQGHLIPNDPSFAQSWGLRNTGQSAGLIDWDMDADLAWDLSLGSASMISVVIDTGARLSHPDLNAGAGADFTGQGSGGNPFNACDQHGTPVAACISQRINNSIGTAGVAPNTQAASARAFISNTPSCNGGWTAQGSWTVSAINWAVSIGARVTNNSNGYGFTSGTIESAYSSTRTSGQLIHFASAGNSGASGISYPASVASVNAVAATNRFGNRASFSSFGSGLDFSAPGEGILACDDLGASGYVSGDYVFVNGTSFASPYTAGVAALVRGVYPGYSSIRVEQVLQESCIDIFAAGYDTNSGWGHVNAHRALVFACPADVNKDGDTDLADFFGFFQSYDLQQPAADLNLDGSVDLADFFGFFQSYDLGCV